MEITKVYREHLPKSKLAGKRYTNRDRDESGTFARHWQACFREDWPAALRPGIIAEMGDSLVGAMRMLGDGTEAFEYWIGALLAPDAEVPAGFESVNIPAGELGVCWLSGNDKNGELYSMEASELAMGSFAAQGWKVAEQGWFFERYNMERFTVPDQAGNVILDICACLHS